MQPREFQVEDSMDIVTAVIEGKVPILNEPPGFGKTAVLANAVLNLASMESRVVVITPTKYLATEWGEELAKYGVYDKITVLHGKGNFKCFIEKTQADDPRIVCNLRDYVYNKVKACPYYAPVLGKYEFQFFEREAVSYVEYDSVNGARIAWRRQQGNCDYYSQLYDMADSRFVITNIHYALSLMMVGLMPKPHILVLDEVDEYLSTIVKTVEISRKDVEKLFDTLIQLDLEKGKSLYENRIKAIGLLKQESRRLKTYYELVSLLEPVVNAVLSKVYDRWVMTLKRALSVKYVSYVEVSEEKMRVAVSYVDILRALITNANIVIMSTGSPLTENAINTLLKIYGISAPISIIRRKPFVGRRIYVLRREPMQFTYYMFENNKNQFCKAIAELAEMLLQYSQKLFGVKRLYIPVISYKYFDECGLSRLWSNYMDRDKTHEEKMEMLRKFKSGELEMLISESAGRGVSFPERGAVMIFKRPVPSTNSPSVKVMISMTRGIDYMELYGVSKVLQYVSRFLRTPESEVLVGTLDARVYHDLWAVYKKQGGEMYWVDERGIYEYDLAIQT